MRYSASEKFEIIELVEQSSLPIRRTLAPIGIPRSTFYDWYSRYQEGGIEALVDGKPRPRRIWNKVWGDYSQARSGPTATSAATAAWRRSMRLSPDDGQEQPADRRSDHRLDRRERGHAMIYARSP